MKYLLWLLKAAIFFTLFAFALNNQQTVTVHFFFGTFWQAPLVLVVLAKLGLDWFFATERGLAIRATGSNARMARAQGIHTGAMVLLGMAGAVPA